MNNEALISAVEKSLKEKPRFFVDLENRSIIPITDPNKAYFDHKSKIWISFKDMDVEQIIDFYWQRYGIRLPEEIACATYKSNINGFEIPKSVLLAMSIEKIPGANIIEHLDTVLDINVIKVTITQFVKSIAKYDAQHDASLMDLISRLRQGKLRKSDSEDKSHVLRTAAKFALIYDLALQKDKQLMILYDFIIKQTSLDLPKDYYSIARIISGCVLSADLWRISSYKVAEVLKVAALRAQGVELQDIAEPLGKNSDTLRRMLSKSLSPGFRLLFNARKINLT